MHTDEPDRGALGCVIGIGASAGGVDALLRLLHHLDDDLRAAVLVVMHVPATGRRLRAPILNRGTVLDVRVPGDGEELAPGRCTWRPRIAIWSS